MIVLARGGGSILYFLPTLAFLLLGLLVIFRLNRQPPPREGPEDEEAQELHRRARRKRALRRRDLDRRRRDNLR
jgi:hypothetical protein